MTFNYSYDKESKHVIIKPGSGRTTIIHVCTQNDDIVQYDDTTIDHFW